MMCDSLSLASGSADSQQHCPPHTQPALFVFLAESAKATWVMTDGQRLIQQLNTVLDCRTLPEPVFSMFRPRWLV
eukprot:14809013-Alexandrium_andersonii.AAC.1